MLFLTNGSCTKPDIGDHSFSCYINGKLFVPKGYTGFSTSPYHDGLALLQYEDHFSASVFNYKKKMGFISR